MRKSLEHLRDISVRDKDVRPTVVVAVHKSCSPTDRRVTGTRELEIPGDIREALRHLVAVEAERLKSVASDDQIQLAVAVKISKSAAMFPIVRPSALRAVPEAS